MNIETLKNPKTKVVIAYKEKNSIYRFDSVIRYVDNNDCLVSTDFYGWFHKPKRKTKAELYVKTEEGAFESDVVINDISVLLNEITFYFDTPKAWEIRESRKDIRAKTNLPICVKYEDFEVKSTAVNLSMGGVKINETTIIPEKYKNKTALITLFLPDNENLSLQAFFARKEVNDEFNDDTTSNTFEFKSLTLIEKIKISKYIKHVLENPEISNK